MPHPNGLTGVDNDLDLPEQEGTKNYAMSITVRSLVDAEEEMNRALEEVVI